MSIVSTGGSGTITLTDDGKSGKKKSGLSSSQQKTLQDLLTKATAGLSPAQLKQLQQMLTATSAPASTLTSNDLNLNESGGFTPSSLSIFKSPLTAAQAKNYGVLSARKKAGTLGAAGSKALDSLLGKVNKARNAWKAATPDALEGLLPAQQKQLDLLGQQNKAGTLGAPGRALLQSLQKLAKQKQTGLAAYNTAGQARFDAMPPVAPGQELNTTPSSDLAQRAKWSILQRRGYAATVTRGHGDPGFGASVLRV